MSDPTSPPPGTRRTRWIWASAALAVLAAGCLAWALALRADLHAAEQDNQALQAQIDQAAHAGGSAIEEAKVLYADVNEQLGAMTETLAATEQDLERAKRVAATAAATAAVATAAAVKARRKAEQAGEEAAAEGRRAEDATTEADKAEAEVEQAQAEAEQAKAQADEADAEREKAVADADVVKSRATIVAGCAKAYASALGGLFDGEGFEDQAPGVREDLRAITADCKTALSGA